jgi:2-iminobutanoate/2-iminopropanoate deaminase
MGIQKIYTSNAPTPGGHYSQATVHNGVVYVAGQLPMVPGSSEHVVLSIEEQAEQTLNNLRAVLEAANSDFDYLLKVTIYISDMALWGKVNAVYTRMLGENKPARAIVPCNLLHYGYQIEIEAIAAQKS